MLEKVLKNKYMSTHIEDNVRQVESHFNDIQNYLQCDPINPQLADQEHMVSGKLRKIKNEFALYNNQKAKLNWLKFGDDNTKRFYNNIKQRRNVDTIRTLHIEGIRTTDQCKIQHAYIQYSKGILGGKLGNRQRVKIDVINEGPSLNAHHTQLLNLQFTSLIASMATTTVSIKRRESLLGMTLWREFNTFLIQVYSLKHET